MLSQVYAAQAQESAERIAAVAVERMREAEAAAARTGGARRSTESGLLTEALSKTIKSTSDTLQYRKKY